MCDEETEAENAVFLKRRELGLGAAASAAALLTGCKPAQPSEDPSPQPTVTGGRVPAAGETAGTTGQMVTIATPDGEAEAFFVTPTTGKHPAILIWPDVAGLRDAFRTMAARLAGEGYAVLAVNLYYRSSSMPVLEHFDEWRTDEGRAKIAPMIEALSPEGIASDAEAFIAWLDQQEQVDTSRKVGTTGYCMGGPFTFRTASAVPDRVGVFGSFHGGGLVTEEPDSPHLLLDGVDASMLVCIAENDDARQPEAKETLREAAEKAGVAAEVEVYAANHGWCVVDSPVYDEEQAELAWARMLAQFTGL